MTTPVIKHTLRDTPGETYPHMVFRSVGRYADGFGILSKTPLTRTRILTDGFASVTQSPEEQGIWSSFVGERELRFRMDFIDQVKGPGF